MANMTKEEIKLAHELFDPYHGNNEVERMIKTREFNLGRKLGLRMCQQIVKKITEAITPPSKDKQ